MLFFNWINLVRYTKGDPFKTVSTLRDYCNNKPLKYGLKTQLKGNSFLLNTAILEDTQTDILYIYQYLLLAARRDYAFYKLYGARSLPISYYPDIDLSSINHNPLLKVINNEIHFKLEENN